MPRYVDADAWEPYFYEHMDDAHMTAAKNALDDMPTIDAVEVVRCKDCKHHTEEDLGMVYCPHVIGGWESMFHFCSHGERREDD